MKHREPDITGCDPPFVSSVSGARVRRIRRALLAPFSNCSQRFLPQEENTSRGCSIPDNRFCYSVIIYFINVVVCFQELHKFQILWVSTISLIYSITACGRTLTGPIINRIKSNWAGTRRERARPYHPESATSLAQLRLNGELIPAATIQNHRDKPSQNSGGC